MVSLGREVRTYGQFGVFQHVRKLSNYKLTRMTAMGRACPTCRRLVISVKQHQIRDFGGNPSYRKESLFIHFIDSFVVT